MKHLLPHTKPENKRFFPQKLSLALSLISMVLLMGLLGACQSATHNVRAEINPKLSTAHWNLPPHMTLGVVPFSQPRFVGQLIAGTIPLDQGKVSRKEIGNINEKLFHALQAQNRAYKQLPLPQSLSSSTLISASTPKALDVWIAHGKALKVNYLLIPQIIEWHQRQGSKAGVRASAHVRAEFFLLDVAQGRIVRRSIYEDKQVGLADDITQIGTFFQRGGAWVTAQEMTQEAITKAIQEMRL